MAKVWFVRRENRLVALGGRPAYQGPFETFLWALDIAVHRYYTDQALVEETQGPPSEFTRDDMVLVELNEADIEVGSGYRVGLYSSPYSPGLATDRLGKPWAG